MKLSRAFSLAPLVLALATRVRSFHDLVDRKSTTYEGGLAERSARVDSRSPHNSGPIVGSRKAAGFGSGPPDFLIDAQPTEVDVLWVHSGGDGTALREEAASPTSAATAITTATTGVSLAEYQVDYSPVPTAAYSSSISVAAAPASTHIVTVGGPAGLRYTPDQLQANVNDVVIFVFLAQNHTATQSSFAEPCVPLANGLNTGFMPNHNGSMSPPPMVAVRVLVSTPIWMYCAQHGHCGKGMVFALNPTAYKSAAVFQSKAISTFGDGTNTSAPGTVNATYGAPAYSSSLAPASGYESSSMVAGPTQAAVDVPTPVSSTSITVGTGTMVPGGSCICAAVCADGSFPVPAAQGINGFGGYSGALPARLVNVP